jgi:putative oxidoreductase
MKQRNYPCQPIPTRRKGPWRRVSPPGSLMLLIARIALASVLAMSCRTNYALFRYEYPLPLIGPELGAQMLSFSGYLFSALLVFGLGTRFAALAMIGLTVLVQVCVHPNAWSTHLVWAALLLPLLVYGGGALSVDGLLERTLVNDDASHL